MGKVIAKYIKEGDKPGHKEIIGETIAKLVLFNKGYNSYSRFLDIDAIDFIIRIKKENSEIVNYDEIQLKYSKYYEDTKYYFFQISKKTFKPRARYYFMFICENVNNIFIIPSKTLEQFYQKGRIRWRKDKPAGDLYIIKREDKWYFRTIAGKDKIEIGDYLNKFEILD